MPKPPPIEDQVASLGAGHDRLTRLVDAHSVTLEDLGEIVTKLWAKQGGAGEETQDTAAPPRVCWMTLDDPDLAARVMDDLVTWLQQVYIQYRHPLPACWEWHPDIIEELLALRHTHWAAYSDKAPTPAGNDWHEKALPGVVKRIAAAASKTHTLDAHCGGHEPVPLPLPGSAARVAAEWAQRGEDWSFTGPEPTELERRTANDHLTRHARWSA